MNDLISRQEMISQLEYCLANLTDYREALEDTLRKVKNTRSAESQWISVKDELPTESDTYWITIQTKNGTRCLSKSLFICERKFFDYEYELSKEGCKIIAWQECNVPTPYEGD